MVALNKRILVVDDEPVVCDSCQRVFGSAGYDVTTALSGREALDACRSESFDVVLVDLKMPDMDGLEVTKAIKHQFPQARIVIITGYGSEDTRRESHRLGVFDYLSKPLTPNQLMEVAEAAITSPADQRFSVEEKPDDEAHELPSDEGMTVSAPLAVTVLGHEEAEAGIKKQELVGSEKLQPVAASSDSGQPDAVPPGNTLKLLAMLLAAPFVGLAFILLLPIFGVGAFFWVLAQAAFRSVAGARC